MDLTVVPYNNHTSKSENQNDDVKKNHNNNIHNNNNNNNNDVADREPVVMNPSNMTVNNTVITVNYKECMRNHAASLGGHANDGCGEFMPRGTTTNNNSNNNNNNNVVVKDQQHEDYSLTCAACGCHRNFHRREVFGGEPPHHLPVHLHSPPPMFALYNGGPAAVPRGHPHHHHHHHHQYHQHHGGDHHHDRGRSETPERVVGPVTLTRSGSTNNTASAKRFRTKFTQEQKEKMLEFAEKIGWRIQRHDDVALNQFCSEIGVKRNVLKVWMHNNKNAHRRRESGPDDSPSEPPPPQQQEEEQPIGL